jgi:hypothetical protein
LLAVNVTDLLEVTAYQVVLALAEQFVAVTVNLP